MLIIESGRRKWVGIGDRKEVWKGTEIGMEIKIETERDECKDRDRDQGREENRRDDEGKIR